MLAGSSSWVGCVKSSQTHLSTAEVLDTGTMTFAPGPSMQERRAWCADVLLPGERRVLIVGGRDGATRLATAEILDINTMTFVPGPVMSLGRSWCAVVSLPGSILVVGGCACGYDDRGAVDTTEALSLQTMYFAVGPTMRTVRAGLAALALPQDHSPRRALVVGGNSGTSYLATTEVLTAAS